MSECLPFESVQFTGFYRIHRVVQLSLLSDYRTSEFPPKRNQETPFILAVILCPISFSCHSLFQCVPARAHTQCGGEGNRGKERETPTSGPH